MEWWAEILLTPHWHIDWKRTTGWLTGQMVPVRRYLLGHFILTQVVTAVPLPQPREWPSGDLLSCFLYWFCCCWPARIMFSNIAWIGFMCGYKCNISSSEQIWGRDFSLVQKPEGDSRYPFMSSCSSPRTREPFFAWRGQARRRRPLMPFPTSLRRLLWSCFVHMFGQ